MSTKTYTQFQTKKTPQSQAIPGSAQVPNSAGGFSFAVDQWKLLERFLILGSEGGTYYIGERELTEQNALNVIKCIKDDGPRVVGMILGISQGGRAPKNDPALFALALAASKGDAITKQNALNVLPQVARIGTHLFHFVQYVEQFRGWGRSLRKAIGQWYLGRTPLALAQQVTKYAQRDGWSHRDLLRLAHVTPSSPEYQAIFHYIVKGGLDAPFTFEESLDFAAMDYLLAVESVKAVDTSEHVVRLIAAHQLPREVIPTEWLKLPEVWEALLPHMGLTAMIRNLGNMSKVGLLTQLSSAEKLVIDKLGNVDTLKKERVHPLAVLLAQSVYASGHGLRGSGEWPVSPRVIDALNEAFYAAFASVTPTGKRILLALDVSGSMAGGSVGGTPLTPRECAAAMALVTARTEPQYGIVAFGDQFAPLDISPKERLDSVVRKTASLGMMGTDCALPILWALGEGYQSSTRWDTGYSRSIRKRNSIVEVDAFVVYTDSETWAGHVHPTQALQMYRQATGIPAKLIVVGMTANQFTIADPSDSGMLDVVGFDASAPAVMADFIRE